MADLKIRCPFPIVQSAASDAGKIEYPLMLLLDQGDGTYKLRVTFSGTVAKRIRSPYPSVTDPTLFPLIPLVDMGDGTYAIKAVNG